MRSIGKNTVSQRVIVVRRARRGQYHFGAKANPLDGRNRFVFGPCDRRALFLLTATPFLDAP